MAKEEKATFDRELLRQRGLEYGCLPEAMLVDALASLPEFSLFLPQKSTVNDMNSKHSRELPNPAFSRQSHLDVLATLNVLRPWLKDVSAKGGYNSTSWCQKHKVDERSILKLKHEVDMRVRDAQRLLHVHHKPDFNGDVVGTAFVINSIIQEAFMPNLCYYTGHKSLGYRELTSHWKVDIPLSPVLDQREPPKFVIYLISRSDPQACTVKATHLLGVTEEDASRLVPELTGGKSIRHLCEDYMVRPFVIDVSAALRRQLQLENNDQSLDKELTKLCGGSNVVIEYNTSAEELTVYCLQKYHSSLKTYIQKKLKCIQKDLQRQEVEIGCPDDTSDYRAILGEGLQCQNLMLPGEFRSLWVLEVWPDLMPCKRIHEALLKDFPDAKLENQEIIQPEQNGHIYFKVTFDTTQEANSALQNTTSELFRLEPVTSGECNSKALQHNNPVQFNCEVRITVTQNRSKQRKQLEPTFLKEYILEEMSNLGIVDTRYHVAIQEDCEDNDRVACIICKDHTVASQVMYMLKTRKSKLTVTNSDNVKEQRKRLRLLLDNGLFHVMEESLSKINNNVEIIQDAKPGKVLLTFKDVEKPRELMIRLTGLFHPETRYLSIEMLRNLFETPNGATLREYLVLRKLVFLHPAQEKKRVLFFVPGNSRRGDSNMACRYIHRRTAKWFKIDLSHPRFPESLAARLCCHDNLPTPTLKDYLNVDVVHVIPEKDLLFYWTSPERQGEVEAKIDAYAQNDVVEYSRDCVACFSSIAKKEHAYTLQGCGHIYCHECLEAQTTVAITCRTFPMICAACDAPFSCEDFLQMVKTQQIKAPMTFISAAIGDFVARRPDQYRFCPKPNCPGVVMPGKLSGKPADTTTICFACQGKVCMNCWNMDHPDMSCEEFDDVRHVVKKWVADLPEQRKHCPHCQMGIEKISGCNNVHCGWCKSSMCWECLKCFQDPDAVYAHLDEIHGGIYG